MSRWRSLVCIAVVALVAVSGCEEEISTGGPLTFPPAAGATASAKGAAAAPEGLPPQEYGPELFVESEDNRDPFRSYEQLFVVRAGGRSLQRKVKAAAFSIDQLKLTAVITRGVRRAMFTDPSGFGWVMQAGDYVGSSDLVNVGGTEGREIEINWRIDRIRGGTSEGSGDVVFIREDPAYPDVPPATRIVPLYPAGPVEPGGGLRVLP